MKLAIKNKGWTLVELLMVVGFISVAGLGVYTAYSKVTQGQSANTESRNIDTLRAGIKSLLAGQSTTVGLTNTLVNGANVTPQNMRTTAITDIVNSFGGAVAITPITLVTTNDGFRITYPAVPAAVCVKMVTGAGVQFERVSIGAAGTVIAKTLGTNTVPDLAITTGATGCGSDTGTGVIINFDSVK